MSRDTCEGAAGWFGCARGFLVAAGILLVVAAVVLATPPSDGRHHMWTFTEDRVGEPPRGWEVVSGAWSVQPDEDGRNRVLVQVGPPLPGFDLPAILAPATPVRDLRAAVKIKLTGGGAFETMGLILRWQYPGTMTVIRVDGSTGRLWVERVQGGKRSLRAGYIARLQGDWNLLRVTAQGDWLNLFLNGHFLGGVREDDPIPGRVGLKAGPGARILLDDFDIEPPATGATG